jgi:hypothetical protein
MSFRLFFTFHHFSFQMTEPSKDSVRCSVLLDTSSELTGSPQPWEIIVETLRLRITLFYLVDKTNSDFTMTHDGYGRSQVHTSRKLTHSRSSDEAPNPDGALKNTVRTESSITGVYLPDPIVFMPLPVNTLCRLYDDFLRLLFLHSWANAYVRIVTCIHGCEKKEKITDKEFFRRDCSSIRKFSYH